MTFDGLTGRLYVDGAETASDASPAIGPILHGSTNPIYLGADRNLTGPGPDDDFLDGRLDARHRDRVRVRDPVMSVD